MIKIKTRALQKAEKRQLRPVVRSEPVVGRPTSQKRLLSKKRTKDNAKLKVKALVPRLGPPGNPNKTEPNQNHIQRKGFRSS